MLESLPGSRRLTLGADRSDDTRELIGRVRHLGVTLHVARVGWMFMLTAAAYNLVRIRKLQPTP